MFSPQLCASGTLGIAAVGLALGHPQHSTAARPTSRKRRMPSRMSLSDSRSLQGVPTTPALPPQPASASTSRLRKRASAGRPLTSSSNMKSAIRTLGSTPETKLNHGLESGGEGYPSLPGSEKSIGHGPFAFEYKGSENTPPHWLRRMSTLSSLRNGSPEPTHQPESSSVSYSNGSTAPILPNFTEFSPGISSRNRLVKRSSSQRLLHSGNSLHSTLRRPATSHARSATLQQQFHGDDGPSRLSLAPSSITTGHGPADEQHIETESQIWLPSFKAPDVGKSRDGALRKRSANSNTYRNETIKTIVPDMTEVATLLMATSLSTNSFDEAPSRRLSNLSRLSRPLTPLGLRSFQRSGTNDERSDDTHAPDPKPRHSFSANETFSSPSPSTWKMLRSGSLRKTKPFARNAGGRRVISAPQSSNSQRSQPDETNPQRPDTMNVAPSGSKQTKVDPQGHSETRTLQHTGCSSPLPPLNRLSTFEIDIPGTIPSYPTTPRAGDTNCSQQDIPDRSLHAVSSPLGPSTSKVRTQRISSAPSEPGSTLLGSDNDNSRLLSGDEDDVDSRSETIYDSTRTGATGSSHSGMRRPPIETIFDESPPPALPSKIKLMGLQDLIHHPGSLSNADDRDDFYLPEREMSTPVRTNVAWRADMDSLDQSHIPQSLEFHSSSPLGALELKSPNQINQDSDPDQDDELWSFEHAEISEAEAVHIHNVYRDENNDTLPASPPSSEVPRKHRSPQDNGGLEKPSKSNIFEWSEHPHADKQSSQAGSPRPKTVHGRQGTDMRGHHMSGRRGSSALHLRSQSVPVHKDMNGRRSHNNQSHLDSWILGNKGPSEDWDGDFDFEDVPRTSKQSSSNNDGIRSNLSSGMLVPRTILERQASVHGQFGQVKELALLVEDLKRLQQQAAGQGIMQGQSVELWKEAEGIINLATLDEEEQDIFPPRSPQSASFDFDIFDEDSPSMRSRRRSGISSPKEDVLNDASGLQPSSRPSQDSIGLETPPRPTSRPRKESTVQAKSVLETIHQQRSHYDAALLDAPFAQRKLPFDTTSLKDLVTRAGVVTRALKEIVRRAENGPETPEPRSSTPRDPPYISQMFHHPPGSPSVSKSPRVAQSPKSSKSPKSQRSGTFMGGNITPSDNEINGHMKMMTVV